MHKNHFKVQDLACPADYGAMRSNGEGIVCEICNTEYPVKEGIPLLLSPNASETDLEYFQTQIEMHLDLVETYTKKRYQPPFSIIYQEYWNRKLITFAGIMPGSKILDLGCGTGILLPALENHGCQVYGIDLSWAMLKASLKVNAPQSSRIVASGDSLPFNDGFFDAVVCRGAIHHFPDPQKAFIEICRVLRPEGVFAFSEPSNDFFLNKLARHMMYSKSDEFHEDDEGFERKTVLPQLKSAGFVPLQSKGFGFVAYTLAGFPDKLGVLNHTPGSSFLTRVFIQLDEIFQHTPLMHNLGLHWMFSARKPSEE